MEEIEGERAHDEVREGVADSGLCGERQKAWLAILHEIPLWWKPARGRTDAGLSADTRVARGWFRALGLIVADIYCYCRALSTLAVVTTWPTWRWVWSATWMSAPPMLVGSCLRPTPRKVLKSAVARVRMRSAAFAK